VTNYESYATMSISGIVISGPKPSWSCDYSQNAFFSLHIQKQSTYRQDISKAPLTGLTCLSLTGEETL